MSDLLELLPWDTEFFGLKIGRVLRWTLDEQSLAEILRLAEEGQFDCLYFQADPDDDVTIELAEQAGFHLVDVRIVLEHPFAPAGRASDGRPAPAPRYSIPGDIRLAPARAEDGPILEEIAVEIGRTSRFYFDRRFPPDACPRLYRAWLSKAMGAERDLVLVAHALPLRPGPCKGRGAEPLEDRLVGLIACGVQSDDDTRLGPSPSGSRRDGIGVIQLAGVKSGWRGRGAGTALVQGALDWFRAQGVRGVEVTTQARNVPAQRLYQQMGFFTRRMSLYYHRWTKSPPQPSRTLAGRRARLEASPKGTQAGGKVNRRLEGQERQQ